MGVKGSALPPRTATCLIYTCRQITAMFRPYRETLSFITHIAANYLLSLTRYDQTKSAGVFLQSWQMFL